MVLHLGSLVMVNWFWLTISLSFLSQEISGAGWPSMKHVRHKDWGEDETIKYETIGPREDQSCKTDDFDFSLTLSYLALHDGYCIRKTLCHFGSIWKKNRTTITPIWITLENIFTLWKEMTYNLRLTFLYNGQLPERIKHRVGSIWQSTVPGKKEFMPRRLSVNSIQLTVPYLWQLSVFC